MTEPGTLEVDVRGHVWEAIVLVLMVSAAFVDAMLIAGIAALAGGDPGEDSATSALVTGIEKSLPGCAAVCVAIAVVLWWLWRRDRRHPSSGAWPVVVSAVVGATVGGAIGFGAVFAWSMAADAAQGPLLGIFVTGPLGGVVGAVTGVFRCLARRRRAVEAAVGT